MSNISALQIFNILRFGTTLLTGILLAKSDLPTAEIALYELLLLLSNTVTFFWVMGGQNAILQYFPTLRTPVKSADGFVPTKDKSTIEQQKLLFNGFLCFSVFSVTAALFLWLFQGFLYQYFNQGEAIAHFDLICWFVLFNTPAFLIHIYYLVLERFKMLLGWGVFTFMSQLLAVVVPVFLGMGLAVSFQVLVVIAVLRYGWLLWMVWQHGKWQADWSVAKTYLLLLTPLALHALIGNSIEYVDSFIVKSYFEAEEVFAIFRYGARELPLSVLLVGAVAAAMIPEIVEDEAAGFDKMKAKIDQLSLFLYPISGLLMLLSPYLFPLVYNEDFADSAHIFNIYLLILSSRILLPQVIVLSRRKNTVLVACSIIELAINIILSLIGVHIYGLVGIAFGSVIAFLLFKLMLILYNQFVLDVPVWRYVSIGKYIVYNLFLMGCYLVSLVFLG